MKRRRTEIETNDSLGIEGFLRPRLRSASKVRMERGDSKTHFWRQVKAGLFKVANINGRLYVDLDSLAEYDRRALAGDFSRGPVGAAAKSAAAKNATGV